MTVLAPLRIAEMCSFVRKASERSYSHVSVQSCSRVAPGPESAHRHDLIAVVEQYCPRQDFAVDIADWSPSRKAPPPFSLGVPEPEVILWHRGEDQL